MIPFVLLVLATAGFRVLGLLGVAFFHRWVLDLRWALAVMFLLTASAHWGRKRQDLIRMVPPWLARPGLFVTLTGVAEAAGALGLLLPATAPLAAGGLILLLLAVFPANVHAARAAVGIGGRSATPLALRGLLQLAFIAAVLAAGFAS